MIRLSPAFRLTATAAMVALALLAMVSVALGADPTALPLEVLAGGDLRSEGEGPGLVGNPLLILLGVVGLGLLTAAVTVLLARIVQRD